MAVLGPWRQTGGILTREPWEPGGSNPRPPEVGQNAVLLFQAPRVWLSGTHIWSNSTSKHRLHPQQPRPSRHRGAERSGRLGVSGGGGDGPAPGSAAPWLPASEPPAVSHDGPTRCCSEGSRPSNPTAKTSVSRGTWTEKAQGGLIPHLYNKPVRTPSHKPLHVPGTKQPVCGSDPWMGAVGGLFLPRWCLLPSWSLAISRALTGSSGPSPRILQVS